VAALALRLALAGFRVERRLREGWSSGVRAPARFVLSTVLWASPPAPSGSKSPLLESVREALSLHHYSPRTREAYVGWVRRFVLFHHRQHPLSMGAGEISTFLSDLATRGKVSASTQNQALAALLFLYGEVLHRPLEFVGGVLHAKRPAGLPVVMSREEVQAVLGHLAPHGFVALRSWLAINGVRLAAR
jgi:hypothetical protein